MTTFIEWGALANVLVFGVLLGAGVPAVYALGVRAMHGPGALDVNGVTRTSRKVVGYACFALCALIAVTGVAFIALGGR